MSYRPNPNNVPWVDSKSDLVAEVRKAPWHARSVSISCATGRYDRLYADPDDRRVTVSFVTRDGPREYHLDKFERPMDNLWALRIGLNSIRLNELRGLGEVLREMYMALPAPTRARDPFEVLGVRSDAPPAVIEASYRALAKAHHPDIGGSPEVMREINAAWEKVKR